MSLANVNVVSPGGNNFPGSWTFPTKAGNTAINAGEPVILVNTTYVGPLTDALPTTSSPLTNGYVGIATSTDTVTASLDGTVDVLIPDQTMVFACKTKSSTAINTAAKLTALINLTAAFDLTSSVYTVDTGTNTSTFGLQIVGGNIATSEVYFIFRPSAFAYF